MSVNVSSRLTFLDLPRELRDYCYLLAVTSPTPLIAWSGGVPGRSVFEFIFRPELETSSQFKTATVNERNTASNLLRSNSIIAEETAIIFYGKNKFVFAGAWTWETVVTWVKNIGPRNCAFVASIDLWQFQPAHAWQTSSGERVKVLDYGMLPLEPPFPRNRHLCRLPNSTSEGIVDTINPAIEEVFKLLGHKRLSKLLLTFSLLRGNIPGIEIDTYEELFSQMWFSMDLPNVVERLRTIYTAGSVDVVWKGDRSRKDFLRDKEDIEAHWNIMEWEDFDKTWSYTHRRTGICTRTYHGTRYTLKIKELPEPLIAEEPAPFSQYGNYHIENGSEPNLKLVWNDFY